VSVLSELLQSDDISWKDTKMGSKTHLLDRNLTCLRSKTLLLDSTERGREREWVVSVVRFQGPYFLSSLAPGFYFYSNIYYLAAWSEWLEGTREWFKPTSLSSSHSHKDHHHLLGLLERWRKERALS